MANMNPPRLPDAPVPEVFDDDLRKLLAAAAAKTPRKTMQDGKEVVTANARFDAARDLAIIGLLIDSGMRLGQIAGSVVRRASR